MTPSNLAATIALGLALAVPAALAHEGATGIVKERMDLMESMGRAALGIARELRGDGALDRPALTAAARRIHENSRRILHNFPPGSDHHPSRSLPAIWTQWEDFQAGARDLQTASAAFLARAETGDRNDLSGRFEEIARVCTSCHRTFRRPKD